MAKIERPVIMIIGRRRIIFLTLAFIAIFAVAALFAFTAKKESVPGSPQKNSLPVNAFPASNIVFQSEIIPPQGKGENYFVNYRLEREKFRQESKNMLAALLDSSEESTRQQAQEKWLELSYKIEKESEIENLLKIKGFKDVIANLALDSVNVVVYTPGLTPEEVNLIQDVVVRITKTRVERIAISSRH